MRVRVHRTEGFQWFFRIGDYASLRVNRGDFAALARLADGETVSLCGRGERCAPVFAKRFDAADDDIGAEAGHGNGFCAIGCELHIQGLQRGFRHNQEWVAVRKSGVSTVAIHVIRVNGAREVIGKTHETQIAALPLPQNLE